MQQLMFIIYKFIYKIAVPIVFFHLISALTFAQDGSYSDNIITTENYRAGIYRSLKEFRTNNPSTFIVPESGSVLKSEGRSLLLIDDKGNSQKVKGKIWGYCDGKNLYYKQKEFCLITVVGRKCVFNLNRGRELTGYYSTVGIPRDYIEYFFDIMKGYPVKLSIATLKQYILKYDIVLANEFEQERLKKEMVFQYIKKFNERNPITDL